MPPGYAEAVERNQDELRKRLGGSGASAAPGTPGAPAAPGAGTMPAPGATPAPKP